MPSQTNSSTPSGNHSEHHPGEVGLLVILTMVIWVTCLFVGLMGCLSRRSDAVPSTNPTVANSQPIEIELTGVSPELSDAALTDMPNDPQQIADPADALSAVVEPTPAIAFAVAVDGPARVVPLANAGFLGTPRPVTGVTTPLAAGPPRHVTRLTFGQGLAANQPAPEYPREAQLAAQEGEVVIDLTIDNDGNIADARVAKPCRWPLLNHAALQTVRDLWHLPPGHPGLYTLPVTFKMRDDAGGNP